MIETLAAILFGGTFLIFFRPGKTPPLENRLLINRPGKYRITLAPKLNLAQPFIQAVAEHLYVDKDAALRSAVLFFVVHDKRVAAHGFTTYLLAVSYRNGVLDFHAEYPSKNPNDNLDVIKAFAIDMSLNLPERDESRDILENEIASALQFVALAQGVSVSLLVE